MDEPIAPIQPKMLTEEEFHVEAMKVGLAVEFLMGLRLVEFSNVINRAHTLGPILDPTLYRDKGIRNLRDLESLVAPLREAQQKIRPAYERMKGIAE